MRLVFTCEVLASEWQIMEEKLYSFSPTKALSTTLQKQLEMRTWKLDISQQQYQSHNLILSH